MTAQSYVRKPDTVVAVQWHSTDPPVYDNMGMMLEAQDGDYVSRNTVTGEVEVFEKQWFEAVFTPTDTPNLVTLSPAQAQAIAAANTPTVVPTVVPPPPVVTQVAPDVPPVAVPVAPPIPAAPAAPPAPIAAPTAGAFVPPEIPSPRSEAGQQ